MQPWKDHYVYTVLAILFTCTLGVYAALAFVGADAAPVVRDVLLAIVGGILGVSIPHGTGDK